MNKEQDLLNLCLFKTVSQLFPKSEENYNKVQQLYMNEEEKRQSIHSIAVSDWVKQEGARKLEESMKKLNLDQTKDIRTDLHTLSLEQLNKAKKVVKNELKHQDECFKAQFSSLPNRFEKEPMRPLQVYYKKLKLAISTREKEGGKEVSDPDRDDEEKDKQLQKEGKKVSSSKEDLKLKLNLGKGFNSNENNYDKQEREKQDKIDRENKEKLEREKEKESLKKVSTNSKKSLMGSVVSSNNESLEINLNPKNPKEVKLNDLMRRKGELRTVLQQQQQEFFEKTSRKIKFHKDILPVEKEQYEYKDVKRDIETLEVELQGQKRSTKKDDFM